MFEILVDGPPVSGVGRACADDRPEPDRPVEEWVDEGWEPPPDPPSPAGVPPSGFAALELDWGTGHPPGMSDTELLDAVVGLDRVVSWAQARQARLLAEFARRRGDDLGAAAETRPSASSPYAPDEIGVALRISRGAAMIRLGQAGLLDEQLPAVLDAWEAGRLDTGKVRAICDAAVLLPAEQAAAVAARVLPRAPEQSVAELRASLARAVLAVDPQGAAERHRAARRGLRVTVSPQPEGMASLWALLSAPDARAAWEWLTRLARGLGAEDPRGMDARRADLLVALLTGRLTALDTSTDGAGDDDPAPDGPVTGAADTVGTGAADTVGTGAADTVADTGAESTGAADTVGTGAADTVGTGAADTVADTGAGSTGAAETAETAETAAGGSAGLGTGAGAEAGASAGETGARPALGGGPGRPVRERLRPVTPGKPLVHVVIPYSTLLGADDRPCELAGYGPIPAELARQIAADAVWKRLVTDPLSGALLDHGRTTYHPPAALADFVRARDLRCRGPRCRRPAAAGELDHHVPYPQGPTSEPNLWAACKHDHDLKHHGGWRVLLHPDRTLEWITPTGYRYSSRPHDYRPDRHGLDAGLPDPEPEPPPPPRPDQDDDPPPF